MLSVDWTCGTWLWLRWLGRTRPRSAEFGILCCLQDWPCSSGITVIANTHTQPDTTGWWCSARKLHRFGWLTMCFAFFVCLFFFKVTAPDFSAVFPNGAGRQAGHGQAALPFPHHIGWIIHHHRHLPPPQGGDGAAAGGQPDLLVLERRGPPQVVIIFLYSLTAEWKLLYRFPITHYYLDSYNLVYRRC